MFTQVWRNWQTRTVQVRVKAISCRFDSCYLHHRETAGSSRLFSCVQSDPQESNLEKARAL